MTQQPIDTTKFILLEGLEFGNRFFTTYISMMIQTTLSTGEVAYKVLGYAASVEEAQIALYGRSYVS